MSEVYGGHMCLKPKFGSLVMHVMLGLLGLTGLDSILSFQDLAEFANLNYSLS